MKKIAFLFSIFLFSFIVRAQELNATVVVNFDQVNASNTTVYKDLEKSLTNFLNGTKWTKDKYLTQEKIECTFKIIVREMVGINQFKGSIQIQSRRPVFGSLYFTPTVNLQDDKVAFNYTQNQQILFNLRSFSGNNLPELLAYYAYLILGYDADSFKINAGTDYFTLSNQIADLAFNQGFEGWEPDGTKTRKLIVTNILNKDLSTLRQSWYVYHRLGLDNMEENTESGKNNIAQALISLNYLNITFTNSYNILDLFLFLKQDEIKQVFSQGGKNSFSKIDELKEVLNKLSPAKNQIWNKLQ